MYLPPHFGDYTPFPAGCPRTIPGRPSWRLRARNCLTCRRLARSSAWHGRCSRRGAAVCGMRLPARDFSLIFGGRMRIVRMSVIASAFLGLLPSCYAATGERFVTDHTVVSRHDPAVKIKVSDSVRYVGSDRFDFTKPQLGTFDAAELFAFADGNQGEPLRKYIWVQDRKSVV